MTHILTCLNEQHVPLALNLAASLERVGLGAQLHAVTFDDAASRAMASAGIKHEQLKARVAAGAGYGTTDFKRIVLHKLRVVRRRLAVSPSLLFLDADVVVLQDPLQHIQRQLLPRVDVYAQSDRRDLGLAVPYELCSGVLFLRRSAASLALLNEAEHLLGRHLSGHGRQALRHYDDQYALNVAIDQLGTPYGMLDPRLFPNGYVYFNKASPFWSEPAEPRPALVHANGIRGLTDKITRLRRHGLWFIDSAPPPRRVSLVGLAARRRVRSPLAAAGTER